MSSFEPSGQQVSIIEGEHSRFVVRAAAGSGKTFVLVQRYLRHVLDEGCDPRSVLAFTFSNRAAIEMRQRIVRELRDRGEVELAQIAETGPISTIHGFCERTLRANALEAGLDPDYEIAEDVGGAELRRAAVREAIASIEDHPAPEVAELVGRLTGRRKYGSRGPYDFLESTVDDLLAAYRGRGWEPEQLAADHMAADQVCAAWRGRLLRQLPDDVAATLQDRRGDPAFYSTLDEALKAPAGGGKRSRQRPQWLKNSMPTAEPIAARDAVALAALAADAWGRLDRMMLSRQCLDFDGLQRLAVRLLELSEPARERIRQTYRHVLVDEAQDLNPIQHRLIEAIDPASIMYVGDSRQSIYGFRQSDPAMFEQKAEELHAWELSLNHRSTESIQRFVDRVGLSLWPDDYVRMIPERPFDLAASIDEPDVEYAGVELWIATRHTQEALAARSIKELIAEGEKAGVIGVLTRDWQFGGRILRELERLGVRARLTRGTSKFYTRLEIRDLANALRAISDPGDDFSLLAVLHSPLAGLSLDSVATLARIGQVSDALPQFVPPIPADAQRLAGFLRWFRPLAERSGRLSAWEALSEVFANSGYLETLASRPRHAETLANVRRLLQLAVDRPDLGPADFANRMGDIESLAHREAEASIIDESEDAVTIMTVHAAKGLEFDVVVLAQTHASEAWKKLDVEIDNAEMGFCPNLEGGPAPYHVYLREQRFTRERDDAARVLYVALTRARRRLAVVTHPQAGTDSFAGMVARAVGLSSRGLPSGFHIRQEPAREPASPTGNLG